MWERRWPRMSGQSSQIRCGSGFSRELSTTVGANQATSKTPIVADVGTER